MNYWLLKSEPDVYSYDTLVADGKGVWDGVRNFQARNHLMAMKAGDLALFYHSNIGKEVVGIVKIITEHYPDPTADSDKWVVVEVVPVQKLHKPVTLQQIKNTPALQNIHLVRQGRLSVMPLKKGEFDLIVQMGSND